MDRFDDDILMQAANETTKEEPKVEDIIKKASKSSEAAKVEPAPTRPIKTYKNDKQGDNSWGASQQWGDHHVPAWRSAPPAQHWGDMQAPAWTTSAPCGSSC